MNNRKLSEEAGLDQDVYTWNQIQLERFAELVRQDERLKCSEDYLADCVAAVEAARLEEREACAKLCESEGARIDASWESCASAIRARGDTK